MRSITSDRNNVSNWVSPNENKAELPSTIVHPDNVKETSMQPEYLSTSSQFASYLIFEQHCRSRTLQLFSLVLGWGEASLTH